MRVLPIVLALSLPGMALAQTTNFKIYPGAVTAFDQTCTSFTSRCSLGAPGGEIFNEFPMQSVDANGAPTDFFRGVGETGLGQCSINGVFYITQDQNCVDQENYDIIVRPLDGGTNSGPDTANANAIIAPGAISLQTPPSGTPGACAWGITVTLTNPVAVPCASSIFAGMSLANNSAWVANGQSTQGSWLAGGGATAGDPGAADSAQISWQITAGGVAGQCGTKRVWDYGLITAGATLNTGVSHGDPICAVDPACGIGGLYPSNSARGDGLVLCARDASVPDGTPVFSFLSFGPSVINIPLVGILQKSIWIGPSPFVQISFGANTITGGEARDTAAFLAPGRLIGLSGSLWFQSVLNYPPLPLAFTNAAASKLTP